MVLWELFRAFRRVTYASISPSNNVTLHAYYWLCPLALLKAINSSQTAILYFYSMGSFLRKADSIINLIQLKLNKNLQSRPGYWSTSLLSNWYLVQLRWTGFCRWFQWNVSGLHICHRYESSCDFYGSWRLQSYPHVLGSKFHSILWDFIEAGIYWHLGVNQIGDVCALIRWTASFLMTVHLLWTFDDGSESHWLVTSIFESPSSSV